MRTIGYESFIDSTADDSDKDFTGVTMSGNDVDVVIEYLLIKFASTATAGNRFITLSVEDPDGNEVFHCHSGTLQAASKTYHYYCMPGIYREAINTTAKEAAIDGTIELPVPANFILPKGYNLRIYDQTAVAAAADDMIVSGLVRMISRD